jgi:hypothetical protein
MKNVPGMIWQLVMKAVADGMTRHNTDSYGSWPNVEPYQMATDVISPARPATARVAPTARPRSRLQAFLTYSLRRHGCYRRPPQYRARTCKSSKVMRRSAPR